MIRPCHLTVWLVAQALLHPFEAFVPPRLKSATKETSVDVFMTSRRLYPFFEASKLARGHGFGSKEEFIEYECAGAYQLPKNPEHVWSDEWRGWDDFLGVPLSFEQGREVARTLQLKSEVEYLKLMEDKTIDDNELASRLPYRPDLRYKHEWQGWDDWLGVKVVSP